jgi:hypothetical protein
VDRMVTRGDALPYFDVWAPLMSLPPLLGTLLPTIPSVVPYLPAAVRRAKRLDTRPAAQGNLAGVVH